MLAEKNKNQCYMVTLRILDKEFDEILENVSLENAFSIIGDYCIEHMIDEPKVSGMITTGNTLILYGDGVTFEIKDYYEEEDKTI